MVRIDNIDITNIGPIKGLNIQFNDHFNIICGQNGIGKTTILDCLAQSFHTHQTSIKRRANQEIGSWTINIKTDDKKESRTFRLKAFGPNDNRFDPQGFFLNAHEIILFKTHRDISYISIDSINSDRKKTIDDFAHETIYGSISNDLKNWFVNRHLWSAHPGYLEPAQIQNIALAKECFQFLDKNYSFSRIDRSNDILLNTPNGEIYFEYLSSGFKSSIAVLMGLIKEVEFRYKNPIKYIREFDGIVFIDEIDLHLHPDWQAKIYEALKIILPNAQVLTTTHSPHIIQVADPKEIIPLTLTATNDITVNQITNTKYGCQGWTVEEILSDVMGMAETRTDAYKSAIAEFNIALDNDKKHAALKQFEILNEMLHPENPLRKILKIQLTSLDD